MGKSKKRRRIKVNTNTPRIPIVNKITLKTPTINGPRLETCGGDPLSTTNVGEKSDARIGKATKTKCLICAIELNSELQVPQDDLETLRHLCQLLKILKLSTSICRFILSTSLPIVLYCPSCEQVVSNCVKISKEIESLRNSLEELTSKVKEGFIEGFYCRPDVDVNDDEKAKASAHMRKTLVQCWTTCRVPINTFLGNKIHEPIPITKSPAIQLSDSELIPDDRQDLRVNILKAEIDSSVNQNEETEADNGELISTTPDIYDDGIDDYREFPRSPSPILSDDESTNSNAIDPLIVTPESEPQVVDPSNEITEAEVEPSPEVALDLNAEEVNGSKKTSNLRRSLRQRPQKRPTYVIEMDDSVSETNSIYSPEAEPDFEVEDLVETCKDSSKVPKRHKKSGRNKLSHPKLKWARRGDGNVSLPYRYRCDICGKNMKSLNSLVSHQKIHRGEFDHPCTKCDRKFTSVLRLKCHYRIGHNIKVDDTDTTHACHFCGKIYDVKFVHDKDSGKSGYLCVFNDCKVISATPRKHREHHKEHHSCMKRDKPDVDLRLFNCKYCDNYYTYEEVASLGEDNKVVFKCTFDETCKEMFPSMLSLSDHHMCAHHGVNSGMDMVNPKKFVCKTCHKVFSKKTGCANHIIIAHTKEFKYFCEICGMGRPTSSKLTDHMKTHLVERSFKCNQCPKTFKRKSILRYHLNKHNGINPYVCEFCGKSFPAVYSVWVHKNTVHKEEIMKNK